MAHTVLLAGLICIAASAGYLAWQLFQRRQGLGGMVALGVALVFLIQLPLHSGGGSTIARIVTPTLTPPGEIIPSPTSSPTPIPTPQGKTPTPKPTAKPTPKPTATPSGTPQPITNGNIQIGGTYHGSAAVDGNVNGTFTLVIRQSGRSFTGSITWKDPYTGETGSFSDGSIASDGTITFTVNNQGGSTTDYNMHKYTDNHLFGYVFSHYYRGTADISAYP